MPALSQSLEFIQHNTNTVSITYPNTATDMIVFTSAPVKGDGYYGSSDGFHTVAYTAHYNFVGTMTMQATLASMPTESDWFEVKDVAVNYTQFDSRTTSTVDYSNFQGNFVWVRAHVEISDGALEVIHFNH